MIYLPIETAVPVSAFDMTKSLRNAKKFIDEILRTGENFSVARKSHLITCSFILATTLRDFDRYNSYEKILLSSFILGKSGAKSIQELFNKKSIITVDDLLQADEDVMKSIAVDIARLNLRMPIIIVALRSNRS